MFSFIHTRTLCLLAIFFLLGLALNAQNESPISIPGNPNGDLPTELLQAVSYVRGMEAVLSLVEKRFPSLTLEVLAARSSWEYSPFSRGAKAIIKDILKGAGSDGKKILDKMDSQTDAAIKKYSAIDSTLKAREFLALVERRAKGEIEVSSVRSNLLWSCPEYQTREEKELLDGYYTKETSKKSDVEVSVEWPMSWKLSTARNPDILQKWRSHGGHGILTGMLRIGTVPVPTGVVLGPDDLHNEATLEMLKEESLGMEFLSFKKTKVNGLPIILVKVKQELEQLNMRLNMFSLIVYHYHYDKLVHLQLMVTASSEADAEAKLKQHESLFLLIANSLHVKTEASPASAAEAPSRNANLEMLSSSPVGYKTYDCKEFGFSVKMPKDIQETKFKHQYGNVGNYSSLDEDRGTIFKVTVNRIDPFVEAAEKGDTGWEDEALDGNFKGWIQGYNVKSEDVDSSKVQWRGQDAIQYKFQCTGFLAKGVTTYHCGITFLHHGSVYNIGTVSLIGFSEAAEDLVGLKKDFSLSGTR